MRIFLFKYLHFFIAGILLVFALAKFLSINISLPNHFFVIEFLSYLFILFLIVHLDKTYYKKIEKEKQLQDEIESIKRTSESRESQLLMRIMKLESREREAILFSTHKKKTLHHLFIDTQKNQDINKNISIILKNFSKTYEIVSGIAYAYNKNNNLFVPCSTFAIDKEIEILPFKTGEGLCGQCATDKKISTITDIPTDYFEVSSGLGTNLPNIIYILPVIKDNQTIAMFEIGSFKEIDIEKIWPDINARITELC